MTIVKSSRFLPFVLVAAALVLGGIAVLARERTYSVPVRAPLESIPFELSGVVPEGSSVRTFTVEGMCCQGCSSKLYGRLMAQAGVSAAAVDPVGGEARAVVRNDVSSATLAELLTFDKYHARVRDPD